MTAPSLESFFAGGGGKSVSWKDKPIGTTVSGTVTAVHPPQQQTDPVTQEKQFKKNGEPKVSVRVDLATSERDPADPEDDGSRGLYVQGWMQGAIGDAIRKATGAPGAPQIGAQITVTLSEREPNTNPVLNPINKFTATYVPPAAAATQQFFGADTAPVLSTASGQPVVHQQAVPPLPGQAGYVAPPPAAPAVPLEPPQGITAAAWSVMPDATKQQLIKAMAEAPPF